MKEDNDHCISSIESLPDELLSIILKNINVKDIVSFSATCKKFNDFVRNNDLFWKKKFKTVYPSDVYTVAESHRDGDWFAEFKYFKILKNCLYAELLKMSPQFYERVTDISLEDVRHYFNLALGKNVSFFYAVYILQQFIKICNFCLESNEGHKPFTLSELYYCKIVLRHLIHTYLTVYWVRNYYEGKLTPEAVVTFFIQWVDTDRSYSAHEVEKKIGEIVAKVKTDLDNPGKKKSKELPKIAYTGSLEADVRLLTAISKVIYKDYGITTTTAANLDALNILKVLESKCGNVIAVAALYHAVASKFGLDLELVSFVNHFFLDYKSEYGGKSETFNINLVNGSIAPKRFCPFGRGVPGTTHGYQPVAFIHYVCSTYQMSMGAIKNWQTKNASLILFFLNSTRDDNPYKNFISYLMYNVDKSSALEASINIVNLTDHQRNLILDLANMNPAPEVTIRPVPPKVRGSNMRYAVGMVCCHLKYQYVCVVRDWDRQFVLSLHQPCSLRASADALEFGLKQPFYYVITGDQTERYVAQENLKEVSHPTRLYHMEEVISREFSHFDGYCYIPNEQKEAEFPNDLPISMMFKNASGL